MSARPVTLDEKLVTQLLVVTDRLKKNSYTPQQKEELLSIIEPFTADVSDENKDMELNMKNVWQYLLTGWAVSSFFASTSETLVETPKESSLERPSVKTDGATLDRIV